MERLRKCLRNKRRGDTTRKKINFYSIAFVASLFFGGTQLGFAQQNNAAKKSEIRDKAYTLIANDYDAYSAVNNDEDYYSFLRLFTSEEATVYNDLLGLSSKKTLAVGDYARLLNGSGVTAKHVSIKNVQMKGEPEKKDGKWKVVITFDKEMAYYDKCNVYFSSREFFDSDYHLTASIVYDDVDGRCRIERIDGKTDNKASLSADYSVFLKSSDKDDMLSYHKKPLSFNSNRQAIMPGKYDSNGFSHPKFKPTDLHPSIDDCRIVTMRYGSDKQKAIALRPHFDLGLGAPLKLSGEKIADDATSSGYSFGVDLGYQFASVSLLKLSFFGGLGISSSTIKDLNYKLTNYNYFAGPEADVDCDTYMRHYEGLNLCQDVKLTELSIPLYLDGEFAFGEIFSAYVDLGVRLNLNMSKTVDQKEASADKIYGIYPQYNNLRFDGAWGFNGFSDTTKEFESSSNLEPNGVSGMNADLIGGLGLRCYIPNSSLAFEIGVGYQAGLGDMISVSKDDTDKTPVVDYTVAEGERIISLTDMLKGVKRQALNLKIGLVYKF